ncbi:hypothetical protein BMS3Bbin02_01318 [bacterium BMS3Bbin02]|nr:hypothetical protein BMS3Bbin02_01318 [bacterium BMS3Bbin02]HDH24610.1 hypothetical protein [Actinomycetota bacterium]
MEQAGIAVQSERPRGRPAKRFSPGRICAESDCVTFLSTYNPNDTCFRHSPIRFPRTRGRVDSE